MKSRARADIAPPAFLQLAGHPLRWQLLAELSRSDRLVHELSGRIGEPQSLVSYHLGKLREARLVHARRSSADGRDTYYTVDLDRIGGLLSATGGALHPGLRFVPPSRDEAPRDAVKVLFLCTGNSARSQMAEALAKARSQGVVEAFSAGSHPKPVHPHVVRVMRDEHGLDLSACASKHVDVFAGRRFDRVISLCDRVREACPERPGHPETVHWSVANPADGDATYARFQQTASELARRVGFLLAALTDRRTARRAKEKR